MADLGKVMVTPKGAYSSVTRYERLDLVTYNGSAYIALREVTGIAPTDGEIWQLHGQGYPGNAAGVEATDTSGITGAAGSVSDVQTLIDEVAERVTNVSGAAADITATDTSGVVVEAGQSSNMQALIDAVADRVMTKLLLKTDVVSQAVNDPAKAASAALAYAMQQQLDQQNSDYKWRLLETVTGNTRITLPESFNELHITVEHQTGKLYYAFHIIKNDLTVIDKPYYNGYSYDNGKNMVALYVNLTSLYLGTAFLNNNLITSAATVNVFYR